MDDLGLTLSLNFPPPAIRFCNSSSSSLHFNLIQPSLVSSSSPSNLVHPTTDWTNSFASSDRENSTAIRVDTSTKWFLKGIDVNRMAAEAEVSSPNSTVSSISGKRSEERGMSDEEDDDNSRKKLRLSKDQSAVLEESFKVHSTLNPKQKQALAKKLGLRPRQVEVWFQNRRARTKLKQTEVECELMKRCCENLTLENRRLEKEIQELKAFKVVSPQFYMQRSPLPPSPCAHHVNPHQPPPNYHPTPGPTMDPPESKIWWLEYDLVGGS